MSEDNFGAHLHLLVNDVPILGFFFVTVFLAAALIMNNREAWDENARYEVQSTIEMQITPSFLVL